jgi:putative salt-induced outer membrane protein YdiY
MKYFLPLLFIISYSPPGWADVVRFKNGDRLSGEWVRAEEGNVLFKAEAIGEVKIPVDQIAGFTSAEPAVVLLRSGERIQGSLTLLPGGDWQVQLKNGTMQVRQQSIQSIYPEKTLLANGVEQNQKPWQNWKGKGALGYSVVRGDSNAGNLSVDFNATRSQLRLPDLKERSRTNYFLNMIFANTEASSGQRITANSLSSGVRQDFILSHRNFWFLLGQIDRSDTQSLNLRQTYGGGLGHELIQRSRVQMQLLGGMTYVNEHFQTNVNRKNAEGLLGEKLKWKLSEWLAIEHAFNFYPNLTNSGDYRLDTSSTLSTKISSRLSFNTTIADRYLSRPLPNRRSNEFVFTSGLGFTF